jgi:hypothetical protein
MKNLKTMYNQELNDILIRYKHLHETVIILEDCPYLEDDVRTILIDNVVDEIKAHESTFNFFAMKSEGKA